MGDDGLQIKQKEANERNIQAQSCLLQSIQRASIR